MAKDKKDEKKVIIHNFDGDRNNEIVTKKNIGLKTSDKKSIFDSMPKKPSEEEFVKQATEANEQMNAHGIKATELALQWKKVLDDKTLPQNRNIFAADIERELLSGLIGLATAMNTDPHEDEGVGSVGLITLLLRSVLIQRDKINQLEYALVEIERKLKNTVSTAIDASK